MLLISSETLSSVTIDRTRLILQKGGSGYLTLKNPSESIENVSLTVKDENEESVRNKIIFTPNYLSLKPNESKVVRFMSLGDWESKGELYFLTMDEVPSKKEGFNISLSSRIKIFVRESDSKIDYDHSLSFSCGKGFISVKNQTNEYLSVNRIFYTGHFENDDYGLSMIKPNSQIEVPVNDACKLRNKNISVEYINGYGGMETYEYKVN